MDIRKEMDNVARLEAEIKDSVELMMFTIAKGEPDGVVEFDTARGPVRTSGTLSDDEVMDAYFTGESLMPFRQLSREDKYCTRAYNYLTKARAILAEAFREVIPKKGGSVTVEGGHGDITVRWEKDSVVCEENGETAMIVDGSKVGLCDPFRALPVLEKICQKMEDEKII